MSKYWQDRFIEEEKRTHELADDEVRRMQLQYEKALSSMNKDIEVWCSRIAKNNEVSLAEAKKLLNNKELKEFKWSLEEYIKHGKENGINADWSKQLENASAKVHIERLEAMKLQVRGEIEKLYNGRESSMENFLKTVYKDSYYHTAFEIAKGTGIGTNLYKLNDKLVSSVIKKPWAPDGINFSERIWNDKNKLINTLHTEMTQAFIRGDSPEKLINKISDAMNVKKHVAARLVYTESAAYASKAREQTLRDLDVEKYEIVATLDSRTSEICQELDGKVFDMKDYEIGTTAPPFHVHCRTTTAPWFEGTNDDGERAARNEETGKTEYVPANMSYKDWKKSYVREEENLDGEISGKDLTNRQKEYIMEENLLDEFKQAIQDGNSSERKRLAEKLLNEQGLNIPVKVHNIRARGYCGITVDNNVVGIKSYNLQLDDNRDIRYQMKTIFHELYHAKMDGIKTDIYTLGKEKWLMIEETFTESTAMHIMKEAGLADNLMPAYSKYLTETLPKLKMLKEFSHCKSIEDFGEIMFEYRFGNKINAEWTNIYDTLDKMHFNKLDYFLKYSDYISENTDIVIDKLLENYPAFKGSKKDFESNLRKLISKKRLPNNDEENFIFHESLLAAMRLKGVK